MNTTLNTSCLENLILQNGKPQMYRFAGGYDSFDADTIDGYPFDLRPIPFDRFYARAPLAEKYYSISPYAYCAGDPVNCIDPDGRDTYGLDSRGYFYPIKIDGKEELRIIRIGNKTAAPFVTKSTCLKNAVCQMAVPSPPPAHKICNINGKQDRSGRWIHDAVTKCKSILYLYKWILETGPGVEWRVDTFGKNYLLATQHSEQSINSINGLFPGTEEEMKTTDMHNCI